MYGVLPLHRNTTSSKTYIGLELGFGQLGLGFGLGFGLLGLWFRLGLALFVFRRSSIFDEVVGNPMY